VFVALGKQQAMRLRHIVVCGLSGSTLSNKQQDFRKRKFIEKICVLIFCTIFG
jgi:hypothetical protein